jgi:hypothetical protein
MREKVATPSTLRPRVLPEKATGMAHAVLRKTESEDSWLEIGECVDFARRANGWTIDELAGHMPPPKGSERRDPGQVQRWIQGKERPLIDVVFAVKRMRGPLVIALGRLADCCEEETTLRFRRQA